MDNPRSEKVAVVEEVREKLTSADAVVFTEYRGLTVSQLAELRQSVAVGGGEYRVFKNTLVRLAAQALDDSIDLNETLTGPTAIAFVGQKPDGTPGDAVVVAKALKTFAKANPQLVIKGGLLGDNVLSTDEINALAEVAPREELLARFAGGLAAPMRNMAALLQAMTTNFAYGLQALIDAGGAAGAAPSAPAAEEAADGSADDEAAPQAEEAPAEAAEETTEQETTEEAAEGSTAEEE
ncbi:MAG: 50S ribosomal protein L10 [Microthrixaceae bacterium]|nr:50S ribosomal protein L10 [Microthrixaceae bacterium]